MGILIVVVIIFVAVLVILGPLLFLKLRNNKQSDLNFERGMDMVAVLQRPMEEIFVILLTKIFQKHK
jgi:signal transduction histidine kinase